MAGRRPARWENRFDGHYLLPDTKHGVGMLRTLARALGVDKENQRAWLHFVWNLLDDRVLLTKQLIELQFM